MLRLLVVNRLLDPGSEFRIHRQWFVHSAIDELLQSDFRVAEKIGYIALGRRPKGRRRGTPDLAIVEFYHCTYGQSIQVM